MYSESPWDDAFVAAETVLDPHIGKETDDCEYEFDDFEQLERDSGLNCMMEDQQQLQKQDILLEKPLTIPANHRTDDVDSLEYFAMKLFNELDILEPDMILTFQKPTHFQSVSRSDEKPKTAKPERPSTSKRASDEKSIQKATKTQVAQAYGTHSVKPSQNRFKELSQPKIPVIAQFQEKGKNIGAKLKQPEHVESKEIEHHNKMEKMPQNVISSSRTPWVEITHKDYSHLSPRSKGVHKCVTSKHKEFIEKPRPPTPSSRPSSSSVNRSRGGRTHTTLLGTDKTKVENPVEPTEAQRPYNNSSPRKQKVSTKPEPPPIDIFASKPLQWSRKFGEDGRRAILMKKKAKTEIKPPPCLSEDLVDILKPMILSIINSFFEISIEATSFSNQYSSWLDAFFRENIRDAAKDEVLKTNLKSFESIIEAINKTDVLIESGMEGGPADSDEHQAKKWCQTFQTMVEYFGSVPNRRSYNEICICIIWLLREHPRNEDGVAQFLKLESCNKLINSFSLLLADVRATVVDGTDWQCDRGINKAKMDKKQFRVIIDRLRNFHVFESKEFELDNKLADISRLQSSIVSSPGSVFANTIHTSNMTGPSKSMISPGSALMTINHESCPINGQKLSAQSVIMKHVVSMDETKLNTVLNSNNFQQTAISTGIISPSKPTSAGKVRPLGEGKLATHAEPSSRKRLVMQQLADVKNILTFGNQANMIEGHSSNLQDKGQGQVRIVQRDKLIFDQIQASEKYVGSLQSITKTPISTIVPSGTGKVNILCGTHIGMIGFRNAAPSDFVSRPSKFTAQLEKYYQNHNYVMEEVFSSPPYLSENDHKVDYNKVERHGKQKWNARSDDNNGIFDTQTHDEALATFVESPNASVDVFHDCSEDSDEPTLDALGPLRPPIAAELSMSMNNAEDYASHHVFLTSAPNLSLEQKSLLFIGLLADIIRSFLVSFNHIDVPSSLNASLFAAPSYSDNSTCFGG
jgi:hypothetical protein